jgi:2-dehydro-3-deoxy-D-gluconate 5-dehydrogenase
VSGALESRVAVVTGGGRGIGRAIAVGLAEAGADVAVIGRSLDVLEDAVREIEAHGRRGLALRADLLELERIPRLFERVRDELGRLDVLVNSAGVQITGSSLDVTVDEWRTTIDSNLTTLFFCCQHAARRFVEQGRGKIINLGSTFSLVGFPGFAAYCATKGGVLQLTKTLAAEWAPLGINVNAIGPTAVRTEMNAYLLDDPAFLEAFVPKVPAGRVGVVSDVVGAAVFLASAQSDFVHGHLLLVDGGYTAV